MTEEQKQWLAEHPAFKSWRPQGIVSIMGWTDIQWLRPNGTTFPNGDFLPGYGGNLMSSGDTLYVVPYGSFKVGREYMIC